MSPVIWISISGWDRWTIRRFIIILIFISISLEPEQNEKLWGAWRWYQETGNGYTADWGAHVRYCTGGHRYGRIRSSRVYPEGYEGTEYATMKYANGIVMTEQPYREDNANAQGIKFIGDKGWLKVARGVISNVPILPCRKRKRKSGRENMK